MFKRKRGSLAARSLDRLQDAAGAIAEDARSEAGGRLREAIGLANKAYGASRERALDAADSADHFLRGKTFVLLGVAATTALLAGLVLGGKRGPSAPDATATGG